MTQNMKQKLKTEIGELEKETSEWRKGKHHYFSREDPKKCVVVTGYIGPSLCKNCNTGLRIREVILEAKQAHLADLERIGEIIEKIEPRIQIDIIMKMENQAHRDLYLVAYNKGFAYLKKGLKKQIGGEDGSK